MNIAIVTALFDGIGGVETFNGQLIRLFISENHQVDIISADGKSDHLINPFFKTIFGKPYITSANFKRSGKKYDIVICNGEYGFGIKHPKSINIFHMSYLGYRNRLRKGLPLKSYLGLSRGIFLQRYGSKGKFVVAVSDFLKEDLKRQGIHTDMIIPNSVNTEFFRPDPDQERNGRGLFVGRYDPYAKGFDILEKIAAKGLPLDCVTSEKPAGDLIWLGKINHKELPGIYNRYQYLVFPSRYESFGLVPVEAMACGLPVVMSRVGMAWELKREIPEFVVDGWGNNAAETYIEHIRTIMSNWTYYSQKAREFAVKNYDNKMFNEKWLSLINRFEKL